MITTANTQPSMSATQSNAAGQGGWPTPRALDGRVAGQRQRSCDFDQSPVAQARLPSRASKGANSGQPTRSSRPRIQFGTTKQAVQQRYGTPSYDLGRWPGRWTPAANETLSRAAAEARALGHDDVGTEHVLLALVSAERGTAGEVLRGLGVTRDRMLSTACMSRAADAPQPDNRAPAGRHPRRAGLAGRRDPPSTGRQRRRRARRARRAIGCGPRTAQRTPSPPPPAAARRGTLRSCLNHSRDAA